MMAVQDPFYPEPGECSPGMQKYIDLAAGKGSILDLLASQNKLIADFAKAAPGQFSFRYAPAKWSVKQLLCHLIDCEKVFDHRALRFARGDDRPQDGFDENTFAQMAGSDARNPMDILEEFDAVRRSTIAFYKSLPPEVLLKSGQANNKIVTVRALAAITAGHTAHHLNVLRERYNFPGD